MEIERIYKPDMRCQMRAIMLILRIWLPYEPAHSILKKEVSTEQQSPHSLDKRLRPGSRDSGEKRQFRDFQAISHERSNR